MISEMFRLADRRRGLLLTCNPVSHVESVVENGVQLDACDYGADWTGALWRMHRGRWIEWPIGEIVVNYAGALPRAHNIAS
jgi:hypothetical protein